MTDVSTKYCRYCGRLLKSKQSIERGFGMVCYKRHIQSLKGGGLLGRFKNKNKNEHMADEGISSKVLSEGQET